MNFAQRAKKMLEFMLRFQKHLQEMETEFDNSVTSTYQMNQIMSHYEQTLYANYATKETEKKDFRVFEQDIV